MKRSSWRQRLEDLPRADRGLLLAAGVTTVLLAAALAAAPEKFGFRQPEGEEAAPAAVREEAAENAPEAGPETAMTPALAEEEAPAETETAAKGDAVEQPQGTEAAETAPPEASLPEISLQRLAGGELRVIRPYGFDYNPNTEDYRFHRGSDLAASSGQPLFAPAEGTVRQAEEDAYWGGVLVIDFDGWTGILRCVTPRVEAGAQVRAGDFIASVTPAPAEAAQDSHFHLEIETAGQSLDPARCL